MAQQIKFNYNGKPYTLEYNRDAVRTLERSGFVGEELAEKPNIMIPMLFAASFQMHHNKTKQTLIDEIFKKMPNKDKLVGKLTEMLIETRLSLLDDPEDEEGNVEWESV